MSRFFSPIELTCRCGCGNRIDDPHFLQKLDLLREAWGAPLKVTSGFRCPKHNAKVSGTGLTGPHTTGKAIDLEVSGGANRFRFVLLAQKLGFSGIGVARKFIHLDILSNEDNPPRPALWIY